MLMVSLALMYLGISIGHQSDIEDLQDHQPCWEELSNQEAPAAWAQRLIVEGHIDKWRRGFSEEHLRAKVAGLLGRK